MSIQRLVSLCLAAVGMLVAVLAILLVLDNWHDYRAAADAGVLVRLLGDTTRISEAMAPERGATSVALDGDTAARKTLADVRGRLDAAFGMVEAEAGASPLAPAREAGEALRKLREEMTALRGRADAAGGGAPDRIKAFRAEFTQGINGALAAVGAVTGHLQRQLAALDPEVAEPASLVAETWRLRDHAGQISILHINALTAGRSFSAEQIKAIHEETGRVRQVWDELAGLADAPDSPDALRQGLAKIKESYLAPFTALCARVDKAGLGDGAYDMDAAEWRRQSAPMLQAIMAMRDVAIAESLRVAERKSAHAFHNLMLMGVLLGIAVATLGGVVFVIRRRLIGRLAEITVTMTRLAGGDLGVTVPYCAARDEIGTAAAAVQVFKEAAMENLALQRAREEDQRRAREHLRSEMLTLTEMLEGEVATTVGDISIQADRLTEGAQQLSETAKAFQEMARSVDAAAGTASSNVQTVAGATAELEASSQSITAQIASSWQLADSAHRQAGEASSSVGGLIEASARIGDVVSLITAIARQTRMLALNATIEAARAGETGKGFAIVADEVKSLAQQTETGIASVRAQAEGIGATVRQAAGTVEAVAATIDRMNAIAHQVADSADQQRSATAEIMESAAQASGHTDAVARHAGGMLSAADETGGVAEMLVQLSAMVSKDIGALQTRLRIILRNSAGGDRREAPRFPVAIAFSAELGGERFSGHTGDISTSGALLVSDYAPAQAGGPDREALSGVMELSGFGRITFQLLVASPLGLHVRFLSLGAADAETLQETIRRADGENRRFVALAQEVAARAARDFEAAVGKGVLSERDLFSPRYSPVEGTDPPQFLAPHSALTDEVLPPLLEQALTRDPAVVFCCVTDRNGYIATHNRACSQPQRPGDRDWNMAHSRNRRIFDDRTAILSARNKNDFLIQTYIRDMGKSGRVCLKEIAAPIAVGGKHWGAVRLGVRI